MTSLIDNYNRADESPNSDGGKWSHPLFSSDNSMRVSSNACTRVAGGALWGSGYRNDITPGPDCDVWETFTTWGATIELMLRINDPNNASLTSGYLLDCGTTSWGIWKIVANVQTQVGASASQSKANGDKVRFEAIGSTLKGYVTRASVETEIISRTDSTHTGTGRIGHAWSGTATVADDFGGGTISSTTPKSGSDTGAGTDTGSLAAAISGSESRTGTDTATLAATPAASDTGAGSDTPRIAASVGDTASGTEAGAIGTTGSDTGAGSDAQSLVATIPGTDTGSGTETAALALRVLESAQGADSASLAAAVFGSDSGTGSDSGAALQPGVPIGGDSGSGSESASSVAAVSGQQSGTGADTATMSVSYIVSESVIPTDTFSVVVRADVQDAGSGLDASTLSATIPTSELALTSETLALSVVTQENGGGSEAGATGPILMLVLDSAVGTDTVARTGVGATLPAIEAGRVSKRGPGVIAKQGTGRIATTDYGSVS